MGPFQAIAVLNYNNEERQLLTASLKIFMSNTTTVRNIFYYPQVFLYDTVPGNEEARPIALSDRLTTERTFTAATASVGLWCQTRLLAERGELVRIKTQGINPHDVRCLIKSSLVGQFTASLVNTCGGFRMESGYVVFQRYDQRNIKRCCVLHLTFIGTQCGSAKGSTVSVATLRAFFAWDKETASDSVRTSTTRYDLAVLEDLAETIALPDMHLTKVQAFPATGSCKIELNYTFKQYTFILKPLPYRVIYDKSDICIGPYCFWVSIRKRMSWNAASIVCDKYWNSSIVTFPNQAVFGALLEAGLDQINFAAVLQKQIEKGSLPWNWSPNVEYGTFFMKFPNVVHTAGVLVASPFIYVGSSQQVRGNLTILTQLSHILRLLKLKP